MIRIMMIIMTMMMTTMMMTTKMIMTTLTCKPILPTVIEGRRKKGRPKTTWRRTVEKERRGAGWSSWDEARVTAAADRNKWRNSVEALCATRHAEDG